MLFVVLDSDKQTNVTLVKSESLETLYRRLRMGKHESVIAAFDDTSLKVLYCSDFVVVGGL